MKPVALLIAFLFSLPAQAHKFDSVFVSIAEAGTSRYTLHLKLPLTGGRATAVVNLALPADCKTVGESEPQRTPRDWRYKRGVQCEHSLSQRELRLTGLNAAVPNAVIAMRFADGTERVLLADIEDSSFRFSRTAASAAVDASGYLPLGIEHILGGPDHLLFVTGLLLVVLRTRAGTRMLIGTVTAFTLAHSITLALAALGKVSLPSAPVEVIIALSILLLAVELSAAQGSDHQRVAHSLTFRRPWLVAFGFGLIHGFGFAGALREIGLPEQSVGWALFLFNVGVEIGQLLFVAFLVLGGICLQRIRQGLLCPVQHFAVLGIGTLGAFWVIERTAPVLLGS